MSASEIDYLLGKLTKQIKLANLIAWGCIEHRWAVTEEEREISEAMIYNALYSKVGWVEATKPNKSIRKSLFLKLGFTAVQPNLQ